MARTRRPAGRCRCWCIAWCTLRLRWLLILIVAPRFWFVAFIDFAIHITVDRAKGLCVSTFDVTLEHPWFWWLIGIDQALHHLTGFGLSIFMAAN